MYKLLNLKDFVEFLLVYDGWHSVSSDDVTTEHVRAAVKLGVARVNAFGQVRLRDKGKALRWLKVYDEDRDEGPAYNKALAEAAEVALENQKQWLEKRSAEGIGEGSLE